MRWSAHIILTTEICLSMLIETPECKRSFGRPIYGCNDPKKAECEGVECIQLAHYSSGPRKLLQEVKVLICIREVAALNLGRDTDCLD
jgi:hypothetical protein